MKKEWIRYQVSRRLEELKQEYDKKNGKLSHSTEINRNQEQLQWRFFSSFKGAKPLVIPYILILLFFCHELSYSMKNVYKAFTSVMAWCSIVAWWSWKCPWNMWCIRIRESSVTLVVRSSHLLLGWDSILDCNALNMIVIKMMTRLCLFSNDCMGGV